MRFYGQSLEYWMNKDTAEISEAVRALEALEAREDLRMLTVNNFSYLKKQDQKRISSELKSASDPTPKERKPLSMAELAKVIANG
jgi:hypothetical protein